MKKSDIIATSIGNGLNENSVILERCSTEYPLFYIRKNQCIRYSHWKGVPARKYPVACGDGKKVCGTSSFIFAYAYCYKYMLQLSKRAIGMVLSLILFLELFFCHKTSKYSTGAR